MLPALLLRLPSCIWTAALLAIWPWVLLRVPALTLSVPLPACLMLPLVLVRVAALRLRLPLLAAMVPFVLLSTPLGELRLILVSPVPLWTIWPWVLFRLASANVSWPALRLPRVLLRLCALLPLALMLSVPAVVTLALEVLTSPLAAVRAMLAALV